MPRDGEPTRTRLMEVGLELFATRGLYATPLKAIVDAAGQRNASALHYHFGSRDGLLFAIIDRFTGPAEVARGAMLDNNPTRTDLPFLVDAWLTPQDHYFETQEGRWFLAVISQMSDLFANWGNTRTPTQSLRLMNLISDQLVQIDDPAVRHERLTRFLDFTAQSLGARARRIDRPGGIPPRLGQDLWKANLSAMCVGMLSASAPSPARPSPRARAGSR